MEHKPRVVLDTNVFLVAIPEYSLFHVIYQKLINDEFEMLISNEILLEYEEKINPSFSCRKVKTASTTYMWAK